jgi:succinate dehydrogenase / fumarate reductase membrane anchor subunit
LSNLPANDNMSAFPRPNKAGLGWLVQAGSGLLLVVLLCLHVIANHFIVPGGLQTYADVVRYLSNPVVLFLEITFLVAVTGHAALGVRAILFDLRLSQRARQNVNLALGLLSIVAVVYGAWLTSRVIGGLG